MIDIDKYEGHTEGKWTLGEYKGRPSISAVEDVETPTWVRSIARKLNGRTADHALLLDAPLLLAEVKRLREELQKVCLHTDYSMTMIGAVCNICGLEEGDEE